MSLFAHEQLLLTIGKFPGCHRGTKQVNRDGFAGWQGGFDLVLAERDGRLGKRCANPDGGGFVGSVHIYGCICCLPNNHKRKLCKRSYREWMRIELYYGEFSCRSCRRCGADIAGQRHPQLHFFFIHHFYSRFTTQRIDLKLLIAQRHGILSI